MNQTVTKEWVQDQPYTAMLRTYSAAASRLQERLKQLRLELNAAKQCKQHTRASADAQRILERRMDLLRAEYYEVTDCMREIGIYAGKETA